MCEHIPVCVPLIHFCLRALFCLGKTSQFNELETAGPDGGQETRLCVFKQVRANRVHLHSSHLYQWREALSVREEILPHVLAHVACLKICNKWSFIRPMKNITFI